MDIEWWLVILAGLQAVLFYLNYQRSLALSRYLEKLHLEIGHIKTFLETPSRDDQD